MFDGKQNALDRPVELSTQAVQITAAPLRPRPGPGLPLLGKDVDREAGGKERPVIVRELEVVLALDARELGVHQPRLELIEACLCQTTRGLCTQVCSLIADHRRTLAVLITSVVNAGRA
ncbi:hypothetical protein [Streptomyces sp. NPDC059786]|uniref:hypothetical protein n=1 Tax=Streptomyces sp. NPDC059786 TaxID=3346946 RepID=UPI00365D44F3